MAEVEITQRHALETLPQLTLRPSPALITATALLALPSLELEQAVERELAENPALERVEGGACNRCGRSLAAAGCHICERPRRSLSPAAGGDGAAEPAAQPTPAEALLGELAPLLRRG